MDYYFPNSNIKFSDYGLLIGTSYATLLPNVVLIVVAIIITSIMKVLTLILEPMNYELDMTGEEYCKRLAEVNNDLCHSFRMEDGPLPGSSKKSSSVTDQQGSVDCATDLVKSPTAPLDGGNNGSSSTGSHSQRHTGSSSRTYPNGWIPLIESLKVKPGCVKKAIIFGRDVIVTRSVDGDQVNVLDAYCPHMGVHIGIGGKVRQINNDSCVECPFHGWTFRASDGQCVRIPYQSATSKCGIPKQAKLGTWQCVEVDNFIYVWYHADGQPPSWNYEPSKLLTLADWHLAGRSCHLTNMELRNMLENGADMNHFEGIHNDLFLFGGKITKLAPLKHLQDYVRHHWLPEWRPVMDRFGKMTHRAEMKLQSWISVLKFRVFDITVNAHQIGPVRVNLYYDSKWYGKGLLIMNAIPLGGRRTKYVQHIYTKRTLFQTFMAKWVLYGEIRMLERDFFIWNHQKDIKSPIFVPEDKTLKQFRLWYSQFLKRRQRIIIRDSEDLDSRENQRPTNRTDMEF